MANSNQSEAPLPVPARRLSQAEENVEKAVAEMHRESSECAGHHSGASNHSLTRDEGIDYSWENLSYKVKVPVTKRDSKGRDVVTKEMTWKYLIKDLSGTAARGRTLAIMGPSGAGKTTFLNTIAGRIRQDADCVVEGVAFLNKTIFTKDYKKAVSFVAQDDIVMGKETPREALRFNYRMKLGADAATAEVATTEMLARLHLTECADTLLGIPGLLKGVSGGEKKRTNIGSELITNPRILILDEPTTGLDSVNAFRVGQLLSELAHVEGRTVLCTIHCPSSELFAEFDDVILLAKGRVAYHGPREEAPAYFAKLGYPVPPLYNPSEFYMNLLQMEEPGLTQMLDAWEQHRETPEGKSNPCLAPCPAPEFVTPEDTLLLAHCRTQGSGACAQLGLLTARSWRLVVRDPVATFGRAGQTIFFSVLIGLFYLGLDDTAAGVQDRLGAMFMLSINAVMISLMNGVATFPPERAVFLMEQANDSYNAFIYFLAKTIAEFPFQLLFPLLFSVIVYWMLGLYPSAAAFFVFLFIIEMVSNTAYSFGLLATAFFPTVQVAMTFIPIIILPMMIVAGLFANTDRLDPYFVWLNYISFMRYGFLGVAVNEFSRIKSLCPPGMMNCRYKNGNEVLSYLGFQDWRWWYSIIALGVIIVVCRFFAGLALYIQGRGRRANMNFEAGAKKRGQPASRPVTPAPAVEAWK